MSTPSPSIQQPAVIENIRQAMTKDVALKSYADEVAKALMSLRFVPVSERLPEFVYDFEGQDEMEKFDARRSKLCLVIGIMGMGNPSLYLATYCASASNDYEPWWAPEHDDEGYLEAVTYWMYAPEVPK